PDRAAGRGPRGPMSVALVKRPGRLAVREQLGEHRAQGHAPSVHKPETRRAMHTSAYLAICRTSASPVIQYTYMASTAMVWAPTVTGVLGTSVTTGPPSFGILWIAPSLVPK